MQASMFPAWAFRSPCCRCCPIRIKFISGGGIPAAIRAWGAARATTTQTPMSYRGSTTWTQNAFSNANSNTGDGYASFLIGGVSGSTNYPLFPWWKQHYGAIYANDDWKVSRRLTLNLALRYDLNQPSYEKWNRMNGPFDPNVASPVKIDPAIIPSLQAAGVPANQIANLQNLKGGITFAGVNGVPRTESPMRKKNFGPRFGLAYQLNEKLVLRTGFGLYYSNPTN